MESYTIENIYNGLMAKVTQRKDGKYAVTLADLDANETLPSVRIFDDADKAKDYANLITED